MPIVVSLRMPRVPSTCKFHVFMTLLYGDCRLAIGTGGDKGDYRRTYNKQKRVCKWMDELKLKPPSLVPPLFLTNVQDFTAGRTL